MEIKQNFIFMVITISVLMAVGLYKLGFRAEWIGKNNSRKFSIDIIETGLSNFNLKYKKNPVKEGVFVLDKKPRYVIAGYLPHVFSLSLDIPENAKLVFGLGGKYQKESSETTGGRVAVQISIGGQENRLSHLTPH